MGMKAERLLPMKRRMPRYRNTKEPKMKRLATTTEG